MPRRDKTETAEWPINRLRPHPNQAGLFHDTGESDFKELKADIDANGLQHRVGVLPDGTIVYGHRRVEALRSLGRKQVPVVILHGLAAQGAAAVKQRLVLDNYLHRTLSPLAKVRCCVDLTTALNEERKLRRPAWDDQGELRDKAGKMLGQSGRNVDRYLAVARLPMSIQQAFDAGALSLVEAARVATLNAAEQEKIAEAIEQGVPAREAIVPHIPSAKGLHKKAGNALAAFIRALERGLADLEGRADNTKAPGSKDVLTLQQAKRLIEQLLIRT